MTTTAPNYNLKTGYATGDSPTASDFDNLVGAVDNNLAAALAGIGAGTLTGGTAGGPAGLTVPVTAWSGILPATQDRAGFAGASAPAQSVTVDAGGTFTIYAVPVAGQFPDGTDFDTAETGQAALVSISDGTTPDGGTPLVSGIASGSALTNLTDVRVQVGTASLAAAIVALKAALGAVYFASPVPATVAARLAALEASLNGTPGAPSVFWAALQYSPTSPQTIAAYVAGQLPTATPAPTPQALRDDVVAVNVLKNIFALLEVAQTDTYAKTNLDCYVVRPGITDPALIDLANTTATINYQTGYIG